MNRNQIITNLANKIIKEVSYNLRVKNQTNKQLAEHLKFLIEREFEKIENKKDNTL